MAQNPQRPDTPASDQESTIPQRAISQAVVELIQVERGGLVFWARQKFEIGSELQVKMLRDNVPSDVVSQVSTDDSEWVLIRGFVVACRGHRKSDGSFGFRVSLLLDPMMTGDCDEDRIIESSFPTLQLSNSVGVRFGLN